MVVGIVVVGTTFSMLGITLGRAFRMLVRIGLNGACTPLYGEPAIERFLMKFSYYLMAKVERGAIEVIVFGLGGLPRLGVRVARGVLSLVGGNSIAACASFDA